MKKLTLILIAVFCLSLLGCSKDKDAEISVFMAEWEIVTNEMSKKLENGDVDGAKIVFDAKKASLKTKWTNLKDNRKERISEEAGKKIENGVKKKTATLANAVLKASMKLASDRNAVEKMQALMKEYGEIIKE